MNDEEIRAYIGYDEESGDLTWLKKPTYNVEAGQKIGRFDSEGYLIFGFRRRFYKNHRVAWFLHYGKWPEGQIDHINGVKDDNRLENLRVVSCQENLKNKKVYKNSPLGVNGVRRIPSGKFEVRIRQTVVGYFDTLDEAREARKLADEVNGFHPNHGRT